jgi:putative polyhydroxyalkanoate system protein
VPSICIARNHALTPKKARDAAERIARDLKQRFDLDYAWDGDDMTFERPGVSGRMRIDKDRVALDVRLGLLLTPIKPAIEREIHAQLDKLFGGAGKA